MPALAHLSDLALSSPARKRTTIALAAVATLALSQGAYLLLRPTPVPDYEFADLDAVLDFTLLEPSFNDLPIQQRVELISTLIERFKGMGQSDSVLMAAFAAGIQGAAREQLEANASRLMLDMVDLHATGYRDVPPEQRKDYIEGRVVDLARTMSLLAGGNQNASDEALLNEARESAKRDEKYFESGRFTGQQAGRMFNFLSDGIGAHATVHQRARLTIFMRDMTRVLRDEPLD